MVKQLSTVCALVSALAVSGCSGHDKDLTMSEAIEKINAAKRPISSVIGNTSFRVEPYDGRIDIHVYDPSRYLNKDNRRTPSLIVYIRGGNLDDQRDFFSPIHEVPRDGSDIKPKEYAEVLSYLRQAVKEQDSIF